MTIPTTNAPPLTKPYPAPRQGVFAFVLLISLLLHIFGFVSSLEYISLAQKNELIATLASKLSDEIKMPLASNDRVGISVIAQRYGQDPAVSFLGIYDTQGTLIVPVGSDTATLDGIKANIKNDTTVLGDVVIKPTLTSRAELIKTHWLYLLGTVLLHLLIWIAYATLARPLRSLRQDIAKDIKEQLLSQKTAQSVASTPQQSESPAPPNPTEPPPNHALDFDTNNAIVAKITFIDENGLFDVVSHDQTSTYFALCNELLQSTLECLQKNAIASRVSYRILSPFSRDGAVVVFESNDPNDQNISAPLVAAMFVKLFAITNSIVYKKHREHQKFALPIKVIAADGGRLNEATAIANIHPEKTFVLMEQTKIAKISKHMTLIPLTLPNSIHERETFVIGELRDNISRILKAVRRDILSTN